MEGLSLGLEKNEVNIIMGLKDNSKCRALPPLLEDMLVKYFEKKGTMSIGILDSVYAKEEFTEAVSGGQYQMGIVLEKLNDTPIGQGAIKQWKKINPGMRIILVMDKERYATDKVAGLYERGIYDGLFQSDFGREPLLELIDKPRTEQEAYIYYGLDKLAENKIKNENKAVVSEVVSSGEIEDASVLKEDIAVDNSIGEESVVEESVTETGTDSIVQGIGDVSADGKNGSVFAEAGSGISAKNNGESSDILEKENFSVKKKEHVSTRESDAVSQNAETSKDSLPQPSVELPKKRAEAQKVTTTAQTVNSKSVIGFLDDEGKVSKYLRDVADSLKREERVQKNGDDEDSLYGNLVREYSFLKVAHLGEVLRGERDKSYFLDEVYDYLDEFDVDADEKAEAYYKFESFAFGYECLESLIEMDDVTSIHVLDYNNIRVKKKSNRATDSRATANIRFMSGEHYKRFVDNLLQRNMGKLVKEGMVSHFTDRTFSDKYMLSVSVFDAATNSGGVAELIIKKAIKENRMIGDLVGKSISLQEAAVLVYAAQKRKGILLCGPRSSGVMQMMQILLNYIPLDRNGIVLQHRDELTANRHPELLVCQPVMKTEDREGCSLAQFAENALQRDVDYYILSDVRGSEVDSFYKAMNYGFTVWTTIKAMGCEEALLTLVDSIMEQNPDYSRELVAKKIADKFDYVVYMEKLEVLRIAQVRKDSFDVQSGTFRLTTVTGKDAGVN